jgi:hypothetical protein
MTVRIVPFQAKHVAALVMHPGAAVPPIPIDMAEAFARAGPALSAIDESGNVIAAGGLLPRHDCAALVWGLIGYRSSLHLVTLHRAALRLLEERRFPRVEAHVDAASPPNMARWLALLGFRCETPAMEHFMAGDRAGRIYSRIRH